MGETLGQVLGAIGTGLQVYGAVSSGNTARGAKEYEAAQYRYKAASIYGHDIPLKQYEADLLEKQAQAAEEEGEIARQAARIKLAILEKETETPKLPSPIQGMFSSTRTSTSPSPSTTPVTPQDSVPSWN